MGAMPEVARLAEASGQGAGRQTGRQAGMPQRMGRTYQVLHLGRGGAWLWEEVLEDLQGLGGVVAREAAVDNVIPSKTVCEIPRSANKCLPGLQGELPHEHVRF